MARSPLGSHSIGERGVLLRAAAGFAALTLLLFFDLLLTSDIHIPSHAQGDTARYLVYSKLFGYAELRAGNLPLWNPHTFSGAPFVGVFQTAMLYPLNLIYLLVPVRLGISLEMVLHVFVLALGSFVWLRGKGIRPLSAFAASITVVFGAAYSLRILAGQLTVLDTYAWFPWLLVVVDRLSARVSAGPVLAGIAVTTLMILAGHPPSVLMAGFATAAYALPSLLASRERLRLCAALAAVALAPLLLSAVQLWPGLETAAEGLRQSGMSLDFATSHSFPPEHLLTLLVPTAFGDASGFFHTYFGRVFYWDATLYLGVVAFLVALHAAIHVKGRDRSFALIMLALLCLLGMGQYTPLYQVLYYLVPGFDLIRAPSKFVFFATLFAAWLFAQGLDQLSGDGEGRRRTIAIGLGLAGLLGLLGLWTALSPVDGDDGATPLGLALAMRGAGDFKIAGELERWRTSLLEGSLVATALLIAASGLIALQGRARHARLATGLIVALAIAELWVFARVNRGTTRMTADLDLRPSVAEAYRRAGNARVLETAAPSNVALARRNYALWGYDPVILRRYAGFMAFTQGNDLDRMRNPTFLQPRKFHPLHSMLRGRFEVGRADGPIIEHPGAWARFELFREYVVEKDPESILTAMTRDDFDLRRTLILEAEPAVAPETDAAGSGSSRIFVVDQSTDHVDLELQLQTPSLLAMTDTYSQGWRARALEGSVQDEYVLQPANYVMRAVPLEAGRHRLRIEYAPVAYRAGLWCSAATGTLYLAAVALFAGRARRRRVVEGQAS